MQRAFTFLDICSGIGGGRLGLELAGMRCVGYCDTSRLSVKTYKLLHNAENEPYFYNVRTIKTERIPHYDVLIAGFPCQSFSVIGRKDGFNDSRGQIIFHICRLLRETAPKAFILENVKGLVTHDKGRTLEIILSNLRDSGYRIIWQVLNSIEYGVPQMRQRVYFIGFRKDLIEDLGSFSWPEKKEKPPLAKYLIDNNLAASDRLNILSYYLKNPTNNGKYEIKDLRTLEGMILDTRMNDLRIYKERCPTLRSQRDGILYVKHHEIYQLTGYEALLLQGFPKSYADRVKNVVSDRHLLMQAGNAMTVPVIKALGEKVASFLESHE